MVEYKEGDILSHNVQGLICTDPPVPAHNEIRGYKLVKEDQVWHRDTWYERWNWNTDITKGKLWTDNPARGQMKWYEEEIEKLHTGCWVYINGVPTYFNKYCYFFHQWHTLQENIHPTFKETSLEYFRFFKLCEDDPVSAGDIGIKGRRVGLSSMSASVKLLIGLIESNTLQGIVSKTGTDAQEMFFFIKNSLENLPEFLMPDLNKITESEIHFAKPARKITAKNTKASGDKGNNNRIDWRDTGEGAYDQSRQRHITLDEASKFLKVNVQILFSKISQTLVVGASVVGHISVFSTVNKGDKGGDNFRALWDGSDHINGKKDMFGRTTTTLKRFFLDGCRGFLGYIGKYGESVIDDPTPEQTEYLKTVVDPTTGRLACPNPYIGAKRFHEEGRKMRSNDPELLAEYVRMYPFNWKEVFKGANNRCNFNLDELNDQIQLIEDDLLNRGVQENGRRMKMIKGDNGAKIPVDAPDGMWYFLELLEGANNKSMYKGSIKCPDNTIYGVAGLDTYANAKATVDKGSDACLMIHKRYDALNPHNSGMPVAMFIGRPTTKEAFHDQVFWALEYFGIKMLAERAPTDWEDYATDEKRRLASPLNHDNKYGYLITTKLSDKRDTYGVPPQNKEAREQHLTEMIEYALNNMKKIKFLRLLKDMRDFDINDRGDYDACMAWGYALMGLKEAVNKTNAISKKVKFLEIRKSKKYNA